MLLVLTSYGFRSNDEEVVKSEKERSVVVALAALLYTILSLTALPQHIPQRVFHSFTVLVILASYASYVASRKHTAVRVSLAGLTFLYPIFLSLDAHVGMSGDCGATWITRGAWMVAQHVVGSLWHSMGGAPRHGMRVTLLHLCVTVGVLIADGALLRGKTPECSGGMGGRYTAEVFGRTVIQILLPLFSLTIYKHVQSYNTQIGKDASKLCGRGPAHKEVYTRPLNDSGNAIILY